MTKEETKIMRRKYAGMAMQAILTNSNFFYSLVDGSQKSEIPVAAAIARFAVSYADALVNELTTAEG